MAYRLGKQNLKKGIYLTIEKNIGTKRKSDPEPSIANHWVTCMTFKNSILTHLPISRKLSIK
jgi:hypothetical protein